MPIQIPKLEELPKFDTPPVKETVLSVQFLPLTIFSNAHAGWFWKGYLGAEWQEIKEVARLNDQFERFEKDKMWGLPGGISIRTEPLAERHQILRDDHERMIQVQDSRFIYNWKKGDDDYPSYGALLPEFSRQFANFQQFAKDAGNEGLQINQWEVTYVNHLLKGEIWDSSADWHTLLPWLSAPAVGVMDQKPEGFQGEWQLVIGDNYGRLYVNCKHVRLGSAEGQEALALQLTARGPIDEERGIDLEKGFDIGHSSIVLSFENMTSEAAHKYWR